MLTLLRSVHTELLVIAFELADIAKNGYSTHFFAIANTNAIAKSWVWKDPWGG